VAKTRRPFVSQLASQAIHGDQELAHGGDQGDLGEFSAGDESLVVDAQPEVLSDGW